MKVPKIKIVKTTNKHLFSIAKIIDEHKIFSKYGTTGKKVSLNVKKHMTMKDMTVISAMEGDKVVGFAWVSHWGAFMKSAYLRLIAVSKETTSKGVGHLLLNYLEKRFLKPYGFFLLVTSTNKARKFYEREGYKCIGMIKSYIKNGVDECIYYKK